MEKLPIIIIILLILVIVAILVLYNKEKILSVLKKPEKNKEPKENTPSKTPSFGIGFLIPPTIGPFEIKPTRRTRTLGCGTIEQLNENGEVIATFQVGQIHDDGLCINRPKVTCDAPQITIKENNGIEKTVSSNAYYIYRHDANLVLQYRRGIREKIKDIQYVDGDRDINLIYLYDNKIGSAVPTPSFYLIDNTLFCLGEQWFRFKALKSPEINADIFANNRHKRQPEPPVPPVKNDKKAPRRNSTRVFLDNPKPMDNDFLK